MIHFDHPQHRKDIAAAAGCIVNPDIDTSVSRTGETEQLLGGVIYKEFTGASIQMHCAGFTRSWLSRDLLWIAFDYPFTQLKCAKVFGCVPSDNSRALAFDYKLGFKYVTTIPGVYLDSDLVVLEMARADCRWLHLKPRTWSRRT